jgi:hypothetical protein
VGWGHAPGQPLAVGDVVGLHQWLMPGGMKSLLAGGPRWLTGGYKHRFKRAAHSVAHGPGPIL